MITRIVKMTFTQENILSFLETFAASSGSIRSFQGCHHLELLQDARDITVYYTLSRWTSLEDLDNYRSSDLFTSTWAKVKPLFSKRAEAWSMVSTGPI